MTFFDWTDAYDVTLLHASVRDHDEAEAVAAEAERDVIARFTERITAEKQFRFTAEDAPFTFTRGDYSYAVYLLGYDADPAEAEGYAEDREDWTGLCRALRQEIANVASHRLRYYDVDATAHSISRGRRSEARAHGALDPRWPKGWSAALIPYTIANPVYAI